LNTDKVLSFISSVHNVWSRCILADVIELS